MDNNNPVLPLLILAIVFVVLFLICRELLCWYYKINKHIRLEQEILDTLRRIEQKLNTPNSIKQSDPTTPKE